MCDFAAMQTATYVPNKSVVQQQKQAGAVQDSELVEAAEDSEFNTVEEKKTHANEKDTFRRRGKEATYQGVHKAKLQSQHNEDKVSMKMSH